jgi:hypothetical protein
LRQQHAAAVTRSTVQLPVAAGSIDVALADRNWPSIIWVTDGQFRRQAATDPVTAIGGRVECLDPTSS